jgi:NADP-dependent alcohol dehydrogenase
MLNFNFYNPTHIVFGEGKVAELDQLVPKDARVLILLGGRSAKDNGTLDEVTQALANRYSEQFSGIEPNPSYETLMKAVEQVKSNKLDFLLAVGGGSVIDGTKFVAAAVFAKTDPWNILLTVGSEITQALPFGTVLTLAATGSEMNNGSVITRKETHDKLYFKSKQTFPLFSILDPTKSYSLPPRQLANGIADAYTHIMEQYLTYPTNALVQDHFAEGLLQTLIEIGPSLMENPRDYDLQSNLMWTATLALNGLIGAGVPHDWATHMIGHEITALHGLDHAQTLAIILPTMLDLRREEKREKLLQYAERVWKINTGTDAQRIDMAINNTRNFFEQLGIKTRLSAYNIGSKDIQPLLDQLEAHGMVTLGEHNTVNLAMSGKVLEASL